MFKGTITGSRTNGRRIRRAAAAGIERLESRTLMHFDPDHDHFDPVPLAPVIDGTKLSPHTGPFKDVDEMGTIPALNSNEDATAQLYLDFDGSSSMSWAGKTTGLTPAYDTDGDASTFTAGELTNIQNIWARVAESFSPFNINVTTVDPGNNDDHVTTHVVIGGTGSWYGSAGGVAYVGGFYNSASNIAWVFPKMLGNGNAKYTADATAHEAGHTFGLIHQSSYSGSTKTAEYNPGTTAKAPIMGNSYSATRSLWWNGPSSAGASAIQNDVNVLSDEDGPGFGYREDDVAGSTGSATAMDVEDDVVSASGIIEQLSDKDYFSFSTLAGDISMTVSPAALGGMLDAKLSILDGNGDVVTSADTSSLGETVNALVASGTYYVVVESKGTAGDLGQYTLSGTVTTSPNFVAAPGTFAAANSNGDVVLTWVDRSSNETGFVVERSSNGGSTWSEIATPDEGDTTYTDTNVTIGSTYKYRAYAVGAVEDSGYSATVTIGVTPAAPEDLTATAASATQINLEWSDATGETSYRIDRSLNGTTWTQIATPAANAESYSNTGLTANTKYYYRIVAVGAAGNSDPSDAVNTTTTPAAPATLTGTATTSSITLAWAKSTGATGYKVERSLNNTDWSTLTTTLATVATYANASLSQNTTYYYRVRATNTGGDSVPTTTLSKNTLIGAPSDVFVYGATSTSLKVTWADFKGESGYRVEQQSGKIWSQVGTDLAANVSKLVVTGLTGGTSYTFRVKAIGIAAESTASATATGTTLPIAPTTVNATADGTDQVTLTWTNVTGETGYRIERSLDSSTWKWIATAAADATTFTDSMLAAGTEYHYRIRAFNDSGVAAASSIADVTTASNGLVAASVNTRQNRVTWKNVSSETGYIIQRSTNKKTWTVVTGVAANTTSFTDDDLPAGKAYYRVIAFNAKKTWIVKASSRNIV